MIGWVAVLLIAQCPEMQSAQSCDGLVAVRYCFEGDIRRNQPLELVVELVSDDARDARLVVDARMPAHLHGLAHPARLTRIDETNWRITDLVLQMPGKWVISLDIGRDGDTRRVRIPVKVPFQ